MRSSRELALGTALLCLAACSRFASRSSDAAARSDSKAVASSSVAPPESITAAPPAAAAPSAESAASGPIGDQTVTLVSAGEAPRAALRYAPVAARTVDFEMDLALRFAVTIGRRTTPPVVPPAASVGFRARVESVAPDGAIAYAFTVTSAKAHLPGNVQPSAFRGYEDELSKILGAEGRVVVTARGVRRSASPGPRISLEHTVEQVFAYMCERVTPVTVAFPDQPIGVGARWDTEEQLSIQGVKLRQVTHATLTRVHGTEFAVDLAVERVGDRQRVPFGTPPNAGIAEVLMLRTQGAGAVEGDLREIVPKDARLKLDAHVELQTLDGTPRGHIAQDLTTDWKLDMH